MLGRQMVRPGWSLQKAMNTPRRGGQHLLLRQHSQSPAMTARSPCVRHHPRIPKQLWQTGRAFRRTLLSQDLTMACQIRAARSGNGLQFRLITQSGNQGTSRPRSHRPLHPEFSRGSDAVQPHLQRAQHSCSLSFGAPQPWQNSPAFHSWDTNANREGVTFIDSASSIWWFRG